MVNKFHYLRGGSETYHFAVGKALEQRGHEVAWFAMEDSKNEPTKWTKYFVSPADYTSDQGFIQQAKAATTLIYSRESKIKFEKLLKVFRPDVIHLNLVHRQLTFSILDAPSAQGIPVVYTSHDYIPICPNCTMLDSHLNICEACLEKGFLNCVKKRCVKDSLIKSLLAAAEATYLHQRGVYKKFNKVIAPSNFMKKKLLQGDFEDRQVVVMQNFVDNELLDVARSTSYRREKYFLYFGRLSQEKGVDLVVSSFLDAFQKIDKDWKLLIAGDGPCKDEISRLIDEANASDRIILLGHLQQDKMREYIKRASFTIMGSRWYENMPFSIVESFAFGKPVIGANLGGIPEMITSNKTGFLVDANSTAAMTSAIERAAVIDQPTYDDMQTRCKEYVLERCSQDRYVDQLLNLYEGLIESSKEANYEK